MDEQRLGTALLLTERSDKYQTTVYSPCDLTNYSSCKLLGTMLVLSLKHSHRMAVVDVVPMVVMLLQYEGKRFVDPLEYVVLISHLYRTNLPSSS
jgi:hypothetical protein